MSASPRNGDFGVRLGTSFALAMVVPPELETDVSSSLHKVTVIPESPYEPESERLRA